MPHWRGTPDNPYSRIKGKAFSPPSEESGAETHTKKVERAHGHEEPAWYQKAGLMG